MPFPLLSVFTGLIGIASGPEDSKNASETDPLGNTPFWILLVTSAGLMLYVIHFFSQRQPPLVGRDVFFKLLERGQVQAVMMNPNGPYAFVQLIDTYPGSNKQIVVVPMTESSIEFEKTIRQKEKSWGIPDSDHLLIRYGDPRQIGLETPSPIVLMLGGIVLSSLLTIAYIYWGMKRGKLFQQMSTFQNSMPPQFRKTGPGKKTENNKSTTKESSRDAPSSDDRFSGGNPFSWDPFSGFQGMKPVTTTVKFKDVAGLHASKEEVMEFVTYLKDSKKYQALGARLPKGALLLGPPGTGKTLLVKALANESGVPFYSMAGSEFVEVIGGLGASRIRQLFRTARANPPAIIFIDELDSLGRRRGSSEGGGRRPQGGGVSEMEQTLNQLLVEMDGMDTAEGTIVFAATNRADLLDKALLRAGRFDRHIYIDLPNLAERKELLEMYMGKYKLSPKLSKELLVERLSTWTPGMSGADIARLCNEAALVAARRDDSSEGVLAEDYEVAFERILAGAAKNSNPLAPPERHVAAVQEAGRALVAWLLPNSGIRPVKISIIPRTMAGMDGTGGLGFTHMVPKERQLYNTEELKDRMAILLGGRAAEQVVFNAVSDVSQRYLTAANDLAFKQVREWGLSKVIGNLSFQGDSSGNEYTMKPYSQRTQLLIELEARQLVTSAFTNCVDLLQANRNLLQSLIDALLEKETLTYDELIGICKG